ncbi:MAG: hypothetical protein M1817_000969 [Caeruleum heppii]|nr:MAG: hypothetical protein M1817_000969 [Caeruleum heppii]
MAEPSDPPAAPPPTNDSSEDSQRAQLASLIARATHQYSLKNYADASDLYAQASELQATLNGETSTDNADLLFLYGRSLYQVGVSKSDVLGGTSGAEKDGTTKPKGTSKPKGSGSHTVKEEKVTNGDERIAEEVVTKVVENKDSTEKSQKPDDGPNKPFFQFTGDENWDDSDNEDVKEGVEEGPDGDGEVPGEGGEEEDDLTSAWNILDLSRVLFDRKASDLTSTQSTANGKSSHPPPDLRHVRERLSDVHDLLAEISLEGEKFPAAVMDFRQSLALKEELYDEEDGIIAEAHYKLSLALEFASSTAPAADGTDAAKETDKQPPPDQQVDEAGREEAALEMEAAIRSCKLRVKKLEAALTAGDSREANTEDEATKTRATIKDVREMIGDMEQRVTELRLPPLSLSNPSNTHAGSANDDPLHGILGSLLGETPVEQRKRLDEATKGARDLTGLVRRKKDDEKPEEQGGGKRKAEGDHEGVGEVDGGMKGKKVRVEDVPDEGS